MTGTQAFALALDFVLAHEGGYVHDPRDPGGETNFGISKRAYPDMDIKALTREQASEIYHRDYWAKIGGDVLPNRLAALVFDMAVNAGIGRAVKILQRSLNMAFDAGLAEDGVYGPATARAMNSLRLQMSDESRLCDRYIVERCRYYLTICETKPDLRAFMRGWLNRVLAIDDYVRRTIA
ncbi:glycoside hydrolase family 108 protein [Desulfocurvibacter africanus]|uniref:glycoside hydrolase family 108 protein n=1 Tax=Desulfocurvibacter africanus TaxID=873 RepID=UPI00041F84C5|nr:glycosyl hydrolase 108 family protein [Desulfocurvibacter africanus]